MTRRVPCPAAPGPLEDYAARFDDLFHSLAQRRGFREYLAGLLAPRDRNKTLTALAGAEPVAGAQHPAVQRLQFFLSESRWDPEQVNTRRLELLAADPATAPHGGGVLVIDDSGDRKDGTKTAHVGRQWLGRYGKTDNGVVTVTTVWAEALREQLAFVAPAEPKDSAGNGSLLTARRHRYPSREVHERSIAGTWQVSKRSAETHTHRPAVSRLVRGRSLHSAAHLQTRRARPATPACQSERYHDLSRVLATARGSRGPSPRPASDLPAAWRLITQDGGPSKSRSKRFGEPLAPPRIRPPYVRNHCYAAAPSGTS